MKMNVDLIMQILGIGLIVAIGESLLREAGKTEYTTIMKLVGLVVSIAVLIPEIADLFELIRTSFGL